MATEIATRPTVTPEVAKSLSQRQLSEHRAKIAFDVQVVLSAYFQPHESDEIKAAQLAWWCDELQDWTQEQVVWALRDWTRKNPRHRPTPGDILRICKEARGRKLAQQSKPQPQVEDKDRITADRAAEILAEAGFAAKRFGVDE